MINSQIEYLLPEVYFLFSTTGICLWYLPLYNSMWNQKTLFWVFYYHLTCNSRSIHWLWFSFCVESFLYLFFLAVQTNMSLFPHFSSDYGNFWVGIEIAHRLHNHHFLWCSFVLKIDHQNRMEKSIFSCGTCLQFLS